MFCLACAYALTDLAEPRCPECGREFDPADALTFHHKRPSFIGLRTHQILGGVQWFLVVVSGGFLAPALNYGLAWLVLGRQPQPNMDDPRSVPGLGWFYIVCWFWFLLAMPGALFGALLPLFVWHKSEPKPSAWWTAVRCLLSAAVCLLSLVLTWRLVRASRIGEWFMD